MEVKDIIKEGRPTEPKGAYTFVELASVFTDYCYKLGVHDGYDYAIKEARKQMIEKAIKWLEENADKYLFNTWGGTGYVPKCSIRLFDDFKKAMEE